MEYEVDYEIRAIIIICKETHMKIAFPEAPQHVLPPKWRERFQAALEVIRITGTVKNGVIQQSHQFCNCMRSRNAQHSVCFELHQAKTGLFKGFYKTYPGKFCT